MQLFILLEKSENIYFIRSETHVEAVLTTGRALFYARYLPAVKLVKNVGKLLLHHLPKLVKL